MNKEGMLQWMEEASLEELISRWRFEPIGSVWFQTDVGQAYGAILARRRGECTPEQWTEASKEADRVAMRRAQSECYKCTHRRAVPGNHHIACAHPDPKMTGNQHGVDHGWFYYPNLFDPVWKTRLCAHFIQVVAQGDPHAT